MILNKTQQSTRANRTNSFYQMNFKLFLTRIKMFVRCIPFQGIILHIFTGETIRKEGNWKSNLIDIQRIETATYSNKAYFPEEHFLYFLEIKCF